MNVVERGGELWRGVALILAGGLALGAAYNYLGLQKGAGWGLAWVGQPPEVALAAVDGLSGPAGGAGGSAVISDDPMAIPDAGDGLPQIPDLDRPIEVHLAALKRLVDAQAALVVDAREPHEYAESHIPGAISMPFDEVVTDPLRLEQLETGGRPIVTYCGGGGCELSLSLAKELIVAGHRKVLVYTGGFPEWVAAGHPIAAGAAQGS